MLSDDAGRTLRQVVLVVAVRRADNGVDVLPTRHRWEAESETGHEDLVAIATLR
jgi:hypothetical protein